MENKINNNNNLNTNNTEILNSLKDLILKIKIDINDDELNLSGNKNELYRDWLKNKLTFEDDKHMDMIYEKQNILNQIIKIYENNKK